MNLFANPKEWWLPLSSTAQAELAGSSQPYSAPGNRQQAEINRLSLQAVLEWLQEDVRNAAAWLPAEQWPAVWEMVNGAAICLGATRLVLLPTEGIDADELEVPQEWVDIPTWAGDYYLAVQVKLEAGWVRVWGYATHAEIKRLGRYDAGDRTYALDADHLTQDLNAFWATYQLCGAPQTRSQIAPLPDLTPQHANNLLRRVANPALAFPRLALPFRLWGALLAQDNWRQAMYQQRCGMANSAPLQPSVTQLSDWMRGQLSAAWQMVNTALLPAQVATAWRSSDPSAPNPNLESAALSASPENATTRMQILNLEGGGAIALLMSITPTTDIQMSIRLQLCPAGETALFPASVQAQLLDGTDTVVGTTIVTATETVQFQFSGVVGERFGIQLTLGDQAVTQRFEI
jgi:hypothetical protein